MQVQCECVCLCAAVYIEINDSFSFFPSYPVLLLYSTVLLPSLPGKQSVSQFIHSGPTRVALLLLLMQVR